MSRMAATADHGMFRVEISLTFNSIQEENEFFNPEFAEARMTALQFETNYILKLFNNLAVSWNVSHHDALEFFFGLGGFKHTFVASQPDMTMFVYGKAQAPSKFVGIMFPTGPRAKIAHAMRRYCLPQRPFTMMEEDTLYLDCLN